MSGDARLFAQRMDTLYRTDGEGRMVGSNEWDSRTAPRFHLMRTARGPIARFRHGLPDDLVRRLLDLAAQERDAQALDRLSALHDRYLEVLAEHASVERVWSGPAYLADAEPPADGAAVTIDEHNAGLLRETFKDWLPDVPHRRPFLAQVDAGQAVAICASVRISDAVHCAGVETHPDHRRRGHAVAVVGAWVGAVRDLGATPFYSTSWDNLASQRVAYRLGLRLVGVDLHVT
ncbi:GNAT family N-acetyltransferase [Phenylobacterium sp.]|uniref:GNAT family N-acetyltransferase n=1 Tax=Phenylobacterium sp. TaxID=1871053 RepID=UPI0027375D77|nr:GNAT family N-acetyltransferase [Phenylobacterium sp.]MDP3854977.1 GNAT family N-acetyltransferase [Phenylobacterium sp.]